MHPGIKKGQISAIINKWLKFLGCVVYKPRGSSWNPAGSGFNPRCLCVRAAAATCHKHLGGQTRNSEQSRTDRSSHFDLQLQPENAELGIWTRMTIFGSGASFTLPVMIEEWLASEHIQREWASCIMWLLVMCLLDDNNQCNTVEPWLCSIYWNNQSGESPFGRLTTFTQPWSSSIICF